jgi:NADPH-dependent 2,4-dienoyl-CoA reductase/sulfur reductase-like enzyme
MMMRSADHSARRIVILGGGFGAAYCARALEKRLGRFDVDICPTVVSEDGRVSARRASSRLVVAVRVAPADTYREVAAEVDEVVCPRRRQ